MNRKALDKRLIAVEAWQAKRDAIEQRYHDRIAATLEESKRSTAEYKKTLLAAGAEAAISVQRAIVGTSERKTETAEYEMPKVIETKTFSVFELFPKSGASLVCDLEASCTALRLALESASHDDAQYLIGRVKSLSGALYDLCGHVDHERSMRSMRDLRLNAYSASAPSKPDGIPPSLAADLLPAAEASQGAAAPQTYLDATA